MLQRSLRQRHRNHQQGNGDLNKLKTYSQRQIGEVINGLEIQTILRSERGQPVYGCLCRECGAKGVPVRHEQFSTGAAKCISSLHGRSRFQPTTIQKVKADEAAEQRRNEEERQRPIREAEQRLTETHRKLATVGRDEVVNGQPDPFWSTPEDANISLGLDEAKEFVREQSKLFRAANPWYFPCQENFDAIVNYLIAQRVPIPTLSCFELAASRLRSLGMLKERPEPQPTPAPVQPTTETEPQQDGLTDGWDIESGQPRKYTEREINRMSSAEFKKAFKMWATRDEDRRPRFNRSWYA